MKTYLYFLSLFLILLNCKQESKPPFRPELANPPLNIDGNKLPFFRGKEMDLDGSKEKEPENLRRLSNFTLTTEKNKNIIQDDINGKITLVYFFYTTCRGICPMLTSNLKLILPDLIQTKDLQVIGLSIDPETDTPEKNLIFKEKYKIQTDKWKFLTGDKTLIYDIARNVFNADTKLVSIEGAYDFVHSENIYLLDKEGYLRGIYKGRDRNVAKKIVGDLGRM